MRRKQELMRKEKSKHMATTWQKNRTVQLRFVKLNYRDFNSITSTYSRLKFKARNNKFIANFSKKRQSKKKNQITSIVSIAGNLVERCNSTLLWII